MARMVKCIKLGRNSKDLLSPDSRRTRKEDLAECFQRSLAELAAAQTMMVNEYQLNLSDPNVRKHLLNQCDKYFFGDGVGTECAELCASTEKKCLA